MNELWNIKWYDRQGRAQDLTFELGRGLRYRVVVPEEQDKNQFLRLLLRPPQSALFERCGFDRMQTSQLLSRLPHQMSPYQKRVVGFVRSILMQPKVMVYDSIWHRVSQAEKRQLIGFDEILRNESPSCTGVFVDYDTNMETVLQVQQSFYL
jgi:ABC-type arginine transport system ATPase subunit